MTPREELLAKVVKNTWWMARRYASGRRSYAPSMYNDAINIIIERFPEIELIPDSTALPEEKGIFAKEGE